MKPRLIPVALAALAMGATPRASGADETVEREIDVGGIVRSYRISVPATWDRKSPIPIVLVFHGWGSDPENMVDSTGFDAMVATRHALVVYPRAVRAAKRFEVDPPEGRTSGDVLFVDALLARLRERFVLDERRIFATGFSNGASFCYRLASDRPALIAAIAPVAGSLPALARAAPVVPIPLLHVHGAADDRVPAPPLRGGPTDSVPRWAAWNGCRPEPAVGSSTSAGRFSVRRADYAGPTPRSDASLVLVDGVDHDWPGGRGGMTSRLVLDFFFSHPKDPPPPPPDVRPAAPLPASPAGGNPAAR